jgi:catechol 2,3-dioxygenase-like lactoylglutathione lyase family enzyme
VRRSGTADGGLPIAQQITFLDTRDLARTADFYERILGLRLARDQGTCRIYHVCGSAYLGFCRRDDAPAAAPRVVLTLVTDRVDEWCAHLEARGVEIVKAPAENPPYRIYNGFARDPNGYLIEVQRFWEPLA